MYHIYQITNPTGKIYIGQTGNLENRIRSYKSNCNKTQHIIYRSILKYGWDSHILEIIWQGESKEECDRMEIELIAKYKAENTSLNIKDGGYLNFNFKQTPVFQFDYELNLIMKFDSIKDAGEYNNIMPSAISAAIYNKSYHSKGFIWIPQDEFKEQPFELKKKIRIDKGYILQFDINGNLLNEFKQLKDIEKFIGKDKTSVQVALKKKSYYAYGYLWIYKKDYDNGEIPYWKYKIEKETIINAPYPDEL